MWGGPWGCGLTPGDVEPGGCAGPCVGLAVVTHLLSCSMVKRAVVATSVAWEGWYPLSVAAGTSMRTCGRRGDPAQPPLPLLQLVPAASNTAVAPWQHPVTGNVTPQASPTCSRTPR